MGQVALHQMKEYGLEDRRGEALINYVKENVIGNDVSFEGPFGTRPVTYCDYTASGKPLRFIEDYITDHVYPTYGNTHTTTSIVSLQTTKFRNSARDIISKCVNASEDDVVIFVGSGTTGAVHKLLNVLGLHSQDFDETNTVVFVGPYEHHSNILPWKENGLKVERIREDKDGLIDVNYLTSLLKEYKAKRYNMIASFSASSNVTGILSDTVAVAEKLHEYGALSFWDYAAGAPYLKIDMNPTAAGYKDAVFCSPHKFVGGVGCPGLLIAKKWLFRNQIPHNCGGGTVLFVTRETHTYLTDIEEREEGGTPAIVESIRCGMVFQLKEAIGTDFIEHKEAELCKRAYKAWEKNSNILLLGSKDVLRVPILSFLVINPESGKFLHHNFVSMLLNDMYGIQTRGGCACAGPYAQDLLQMDEEMAQRFITFLEHSDSDGQKKDPQEVMKPGFARLNLPYFYDDDTIDFVLEAVNQVASKGWRIMPLYQFDSKTGTWKHRLHQYNMQSLYDIEYVMAGLKVHKTPNSSRGSPMRATKEHYKEILKKADKLYSNATRLCGVIRCETDPDVQVATGENHLVWFLEPKQAKNLLMKMDKGLHVKTVDAMAENLPFFPKSYSVDNLLDIDSGSVDSLDEASGTDSGVESNDFTDDDVIGSPLKYGSLSRSGKPATDKKAKRILPPMKDLPPQNRVHYAKKMPTYTAESSGAGYLSRHLLNRAKFHGSYGDLSRTGHSGMYHSNESLHILDGATKHPSSNGKAVKLPALKGSKEKGDKVKKDKKRPMPMTTRDLAYGAYRTQWLVLNQKQ